LTLLLAATPNWGSAKCNPWVGVKVEVIVAGIEWYEPEEPIKVRCSTCAGGWRYTGQAGCWGKLDGRIDVYRVRNGDTIEGYWVYLPGKEPQWYTESEFLAKFPSASKTTAKAIRRYGWRLSIGSCGMACAIHGGQWYWAPLD